jgi:hypothetical protein
MQGKVCDDAALAISILALLASIAALLYGKWVNKQIDKR